MSVVEMANLLECPADKGKLGYGQQFTVAETCNHIAASVEVLKLLHIQFSMVAMLSMRITNRQLADTGMAV